MNPIYDELSDRTGVDVPDQQQQWQPSPTPRDDIDVPERPDGSWCEDRSVGDDITDFDGVE